MFYISALQPPACSSFAFPIVRRRRGAQPQRWNAKVDEQTATVLPPVSPDAPGTLLAALSPSLFLRKVRHVFYVIAFDYRNNFIGFFSDMRKSFLPRNKMLCSIIR